jgi:hypothetical protein
LYDHVIELQPHPWQMVQNDGMSVELWSVAALVKLNDSCPILIV